MLPTVRLWITGILFATFCLTGAAAHGQQTGSVAGRVLDQTGGVLPGVTIDLVVNRTELTTTTDGEGRYRFDRVPAGSAELTCRLLNFSVMRRAINVPAETRSSQIS
jgi:hypothetical protein